MIRHFELLERNSQLVSFSLLFIFLGNCQEMIQERNTPEIISIYPLHLMSVGFSLVLRLSL